MVLEGEGELEWQALESDSSYDGQTRRNCRRSGCLLKAKSIETYWNSSYDGETRRNLGR